MFSQASEYALRALAELARRGPEGWMLTSDLAETLRVPVHYLAKVLQTLARRGILESQRGRLGGFRLAHRPEEMTVYDVVYVLDDVHALESCVMGEETCSDETACPLHSLWKNVRGQFVEVLRNTTLRDLAKYQDQRPLSGRFPALMPTNPALQAPAQPRRRKQGAG